MSKNDLQGLEMIKHGRIDLYIPLMYETEGSFEEICSKINQKIDKDIKELQAKVEQGNVDVIHMDIFEGSIEVGASSKELEIYYNKYNELVRFYEHHKKIYGPKFINSQEIFVLFPLHIELNSGEVVWLNANLFVFKNKMGILKIELPLVNVSSAPLMDLGYNAYIKNIESPWLDSMEIQNNTIKDIQDMYIRKIEEDSTICVKPLGNLFRNIILSNFDGMPKQINNISNKVMVDLYRIIVAPVTIMECTSYEKEAQEYIKEHQWTRHNFKHICSTTGACLSITDIAFNDYLLNMHMQEEGINDVKEYEKKYVYEAVAQNLCGDVECAIIIMVLKYMTKKWFCDSSQETSKEMYKVKKEYNLNIKCISEWQEECFGTVSEQIETFEKVMPYYLKEKNTETKLKAIDSIIADREVRNKEELQNFLSMGSFLMAVVFGLPAITETISIIRQVFSCIDVDIPWFTIESFSLCVWIIGLLAIVVWLYLRRKNKSRI